MARYNSRRKLSKKEQKAATRAPISAVPDRIENQAKEVRAKKTLEIPGIITVKDFADRADLPVTTVIGQLMRSGILATINQTIDFDTASIIGDDLGLIITKDQNKSSVTQENIDSTKKESKNLVLRPPVVTIMGHVDHGKTSLLDKIRSTQVAEGESGGITQHISAYQVTLNKKDINVKTRTVTFIDTPGHAAFSTMREHGASITDIVIVIVAADDGVMPQTAEVIEQALSNHVPVIVAINKIDLPGADVMKVKQQLTEYNLVPEEWGGKTVIVEVSAKTGTGVEELLEMVLLQADLMELKADPVEKAVGVVIESHMHKGAGAMALVLIENGTLHQGNPVAIGSSYGKARILQNYAGKPIKEAGPSCPVRIAGLKSLPTFGDKLMAFDNEKEAKDNAAKAERSTATLNIATATKIGFDQIVGEGDGIKEFRIVLKSDVKGSSEAISQSLAEIKSNEVSVKIISQGIGAISESDVTLAKTTGAIVIGFRVGVLAAAKHIAEHENVVIKKYEVIYSLINDIKDALSELLPPEIIEEELGKGKVLAIFRDDKKGFVAGGTVESGKISIGNEIKFYQDKNEKYRDKVLTLRREKSESKECESGNECGFGLPIGANISVGDTWVAFKTIEKKRSLE